MKNNIEHRRVDIELRADETSDGKLTGRAVVYDSETVIGGVFREVFRPGALTKTIKESKNIAMLWNHQDAFPMGSTRAGTLKLREEKDGLHFEVDPPTEAPYSGFVENIRRGDVSQMSFGFSVIKENVVRKDGEMDLREVTEARLYEISPVTFPAYEDTEVEARAREIASRWASEESDVDASSRTTPEPVASADHSVAGRVNPVRVLNRCALLAAAEELLSYENSGVARKAP